MRSISRVQGQGPAAAGVPRVAGLTLCRPVARGVPDRWRARDTSTGHEVLLRPLPPGGAAGRVGSLPQHPHLLVPRVLPDENGRELLVVRWAAHGGLDRLLLRRDGLLPGEASALGLGLARALATLHADGQVHGSVGPGTVLLGEGLRPLLDAVPMLAPPPADATPASDVAALARLLLDASARPVAAELAGLLAAATDPDPVLRPTAADLVRQLATTVPPEAVRLFVGAANNVRDEAASGAATRVRRAVAALLSGCRAAVAHRRREDPPEGRPRGVRQLGGRHGRRTRPAVSGLVRPALRVVAAAGAVLLAVVGGVVWAALSAAGDGRTARVPAVGVPAQGLATASAVLSSAPSASRSSFAPSDEWARVIFDLDRIRAESFQTGDTGGLDAVDAPGSAALASDRDALVRLADRGASAVGYRAVLHSVHLVRAGSGSARVEVVDERPSYELVAADGRVLARPAARGIKRWLVDLVRVDDRWLVQQVTPAGGGP